MAKPKTSKRRNGDAAGKGFVPWITSRPVLGALVTLTAIAGVLWLLSEPEKSSVGDTNGALPAEGMPRISAIEPDDVVFARYSRSATCADCHPGQHQAWRGSHHGLAERPVDGASDRPAFEPGQTFRHGTQTTELSWTNGAPELITDGAGGRRESHVAVRVIGENPLRQFLVPFPGGRFQAMEAAWDPRSNAWFNVYGVEDRKPGEWGHWSGRGMNWNSMCGTCHTTRFRKHYDPTTDVFRSTMAESTVGCESCHGPMKDHADWQRAWRDSGKKDPTLVKRTLPQHMETCAPCHARRGEISGDFTPGDSFWDHYLLSIVDESDVYYPDGQVREEDYEYSAFLGSRMHAAGVTCMDCHDAHSGKTKLPGNDLCMRCHNGSRTGSPIIDPVRHSFHKAGGPGAGCVDCHMPVTTFMQRHDRHDHGFTVPDPHLTRELGIPNACNRCHSEKDSAWAIAICEAWYGSRMDRPSRQRTRTLALARARDEKAVGGLLGLLRSNEPAYWKASAVALLSPWGDQPEVRQAVQGVLNHEHPLVRHRAVQSLSPWFEARNMEVTRHVRERLRDVSRGVRVAAAWALRGQLDDGETAAVELGRMHELNSDQPAGQAQLAVAAMARGQAGKALAHYARAIEWDPGSSGLRHDYAVVLSQSGRSREALEQVREAVRIQPRDAESHYRLGLAWAESGDIGQAVSSLEEALRLDPRHDRAGYNLGLAYHQRGDPGRALSVLESVESVNPRDPRIPYARATILMPMERHEEAAAAARRVLELEPSHAEARQLLEVLENRR